MEHHDRHLGGYEPRSGRSPAHLPERRHRYGAPVYERAVAFASTGWATALIDDLPTGKAGELAVTARLRDAPRVGTRPFYVTVDEDFAHLRSYFGDLHVHSDDTVGTNDTRYNLTYGRDVASLDMLDYTANDFNITRERWDNAVALIHELNRPGEFVCYPGTEWCGSSCAGDDHNVVFLRDGDPEFPFDRHGTTGVTSELPRLTVTRGRASRRRSRPGVRRFRHD